MSNRNLILFNDTLNIEFKYFAYFMTHFVSFFAANIYMALYIGKHGKKFYNK